MAKIVLSEDRKTCDIMGLPFDEVGQVSASGKSHINAKASESIVVEGIPTPIKLNCQIYTKNPDYKAETG